MNLLNWYVFSAGSHSVSSIPYCPNHCGKDVQVLPYFNDCFHQDMEASKMWTGAHAIPRTVLGPYLRNGGAQPKCMKHIPGLTMAVITAII